MNLSVVNQQEGSAPRGAQVKLWDVSSEQPSLVAATDMGVGAIFSAAFCAESPFLVAAGGAKVRRGLWRCCNGCRQHAGEAPPDRPVAVTAGQKLLNVRRRCMRAKAVQQSGRLVVQGTVAVWDTLSTAAVAAKYGQRHRPQSAAAAEDD